MANQFLDQRISIHNDGIGGTDLISDLPLLVGDIGLQVVAANPLITSNVRVALSGTVSIEFAQLPEEPELLDPTVVSLFVQRGGDGTLGTGTQILFQQIEVRLLSTLYPISVTAADFPPAADVLTGQIRYSLFIATDGFIDFVVSGPAVFNGIAVAGST